MTYGIDEKLAYETGVHIGDGNLYTKNRTHKITYTGNLKNEETYYLEILIPLLKEIYNKKPKIHRYKEKNAILLVLNSKDICNFKWNVLQLPNGKKNHITIPKLIKNDLKLLKGCMRGIGDTDFSISFKKNRKGIHTEPRIELFSRSIELVNELHEILLNFDFTVTKKNTIRRGFIENRLRMYGKENLERWMNQFGFQNPYRLLKIQVWKKFGEVLPYQTYQDYVNLLSSR